MEEVEELASNRLLDSLIVISSVGETLTREESEAEDLTASATMRVAAAVGVVNAVRIVRTRAVTVGGKAGELIGERATGRQVGGKETLSNNHLTSKLKKRGGKFSCIS